MNIDTLLILAAVICFALDGFKVQSSVNLVSLGFALLAVTLIV